MALLNIRRFLSDSLCSRPLRLRLTSICSKTELRSSSTIALPSKPQLDSLSDVSEAVYACCSKLGRQPGQEEEDLIQRLKKNWVNTTQDLIALSREEASELLLPIRLRSTVQSLLPDSSPLNIPTPILGPSPLPSPPPLPTSSDPDESIEESREDQKCPRIYQSRGSGWKIKTSTRRRGSAYALTTAQISLTSQTSLDPTNQVSPSLISEFAAFERFCTLKFFGAHHDPVCQRTALNYSAAMRSILGYMHRERSIPLSELSMKHAFPTKDRMGVHLAFDFIQWLATTRGINVRTQSSIIQGLIMGAKFVHHESSTVRVNQGETAYSDLEVISELRAMLRGLKAEIKVAPSATMIEKKWLTWSDYLTLIDRLKAECGGRDSQGRKRSNAAVAQSIQTYLLFSILASIPDRQRTLRELKLGSTLVKDEEGRWLIKHGAKDYKTGKAYGERPPLVISPSIFPLLEAWISEWRAHLNPQHDFLFTRPNGTAFDASSLSRTFSLAAFRLTGQRTTPHMVRDMIVTHLRGSDASEKELEALAIYMGHSIAMQRSTYDRRTKAEKVEPAVELLHLTNLKAKAK